MESSPLTVTVLSREPPPPWLPIQQRKGRTWRPSSNVAGSPRPRRWRRGRRRKKRSGSCNVESLVFIHGSILVDIAGTPHPNKFKGSTNYKIWLIYLNTMSTYLLQTEPQKLPPQREDSTAIQDKNNFFIASMQENDFIFGNFILKETTRSWDL